MTRKPRTPANILRCNRECYARKMAANPRYAAERKAAYRKLHPVILTPAQRKRARAASRRSYRKHRKEILSALARARQEARESDAIEKQLAAVKENGCFRCDGTGHLCNVCGESERACRCNCDDTTWGECPDCKPEARISAANSPTIHN